jgi:hypothetical protein
MMRVAADRGDGEAAYICATIAAQDAALADNWHVALNYLAKSAEAGFSPARAELMVLAGRPPADVTLPKGTWSNIAADLEFAALARVPPVHWHSDSPRIGVVEGFLNATTCDWLVQKSRPWQERAMVYDAGTGSGTEDDVRSNSAASLNILHLGVPLVLARDRILTLLGLSEASLEPPSILYYRPGEQFAPHFDYIDPAIPSFARDIELHGGQRVATFLVYLSEDYSGGETKFLALDWSYKGRKGDGLIFWNVDASGVPDPRTQHAGTETTAGEKWVLSQWIRLPRASGNGR